MNRREIFNLARDTDAVIDIDSRAADNAADTVGWGNRFDANKEFTDAFVDVWFESILGLLSVSDGHTAEEAEWFKAIGVEA
jgi:hypothetical protein